MGLDYRSGKGLDYRLVKGLDNRPKPVIIQTPKDDYFDQMISNVRKNWKWVNDSCWFDSTVFNFLYIRDSYFINLVKSRLNDEKEEIVNLSKFLIESYEIIQGIRDPKKINFCPDTRKLFFEAWNVSENASIKYHLLKNANDKSRPSDKKDYRSITYTGTGHSEYVCEILLGVYLPKFSFKENGQSPEKTSMLNLIFPFDNTDLDKVKVQDIGDYLESKKFTFVGDVPKMLVLNSVPYEEIEGNIPVKPSYPEILKLDSHNYKLRSSVLRMSDPAHFVSIFSDENGNFYYLNIIGPNYISKFKKGEDVNEVSVDDVSLGSNGNQFFYYLEE